MNVTATFETFPFEMRYSYVSVNGTQQFQLHRRRLQSVMFVIVLFILGHVEMAPKMILSRIMNVTTTGHRGGCVT